MIPNEICGKLDSKLVDIYNTVCRIQDCQHDREEIPVYYNVKEISKRFNLSKSSIHKMVSRNEIPATIVAGKYIFEKALVDEYLLSITK